MPRATDIVVNCWLQRHWVSQRTKVFVRMGCGVNRQDPALVECCVGDECTMPESLFENLERPETGTTTVVETVSGSS
jgi:hypothetical protein